jgi:hypothetical protein
MQKLLISYPAKTFNFLSSHNKQALKEINKTIPLTIASKRKKLGINNLGGERPLKYNDQILKKEI